MPVGELKRLMEVFSVSDAGCIEKQHLTDALLEKFRQGRATDAACLPCISQPSQCAICMSNFRDGEVLRQLGCSELHVFCNGCIQQWLDKNTSCPLCRKECGPPAPPEPPPPRPPEIGGPLPSMMTPLGLMASLGGPEHTFLLLDTPFGGGRPTDAADPLAGGVGRALSRAFDALPPSRASSSASPRQTASPRAVAAPRDRAPSRGSAGAIHLPPVHRPNLFTSSAGGSDRGARATPSSVRAAPPSTAAPSTSSNPRRSSRLPSIRPLRLGDMASALPRLPSLGRSSSNVPPSNRRSPITGAGRSLSAAGSGRSFAAARRRRSSNSVAPEAVSL